MRTDVIELPEYVVQYYRRLLAKQTLYDRKPDNFTDKQHIDLEMELMEEAARIIGEYGDEDHQFRQGGIDEVQGVLYVLD